MTIKKIKNLKYSKSKNQEEVRWIEAVAKKNRLLAETDWTQLPDVKLSENSKQLWKRWRESVRLLKRSNTDSIETYINELDSLIEKKKFLLIEYDKNDAFADLASGKLFLHSILVSLYKEKINYNFTPNLNEKYKEVMDIITNHFSENNIDVNISNIDELIEYFENLSDDCTLSDINDYNFLKVVQSVKNYNVRQIIIYILKEQKTYYNLTLQEEYYLLHYEHRIDSCVSIKDVLLAKEEIEMYYGH